MGVCTSLEPAPALKSGAYALGGEEALASVAKHEDPNPDALKLILPYAVPAGGVVPAKQRECSSLPLYALTCVPGGHISLNCLSFPFSACLLAKRASANPAAPVVGPKGTWSCHVCTFLNQSQHLACAVCGSPRRRGSSMKPPPPRSGRPSNVAGVQEQKDDEPPPGHRAIPAPAPAHAPAGDEPIADQAAVPLAADQDPPPIVISIVDDKPNAGADAGMKMALPGEAEEEPGAGGVGDDDEPGGGPGVPDDYADDVGVGDAPGAADDADAAAGGYQLIAPGADDEPGSAAEDSDDSNGPIVADVLALGADDAQDAAPAPEEPQDSEHSDSGGVDVGAGPAAGDNDHDNADGAPPQPAADADASAADAPPLPPQDDVDDE